MANQIRIKRSLAGVKGAPTEADLATGELAYENENDVLYIGRELLGGIAEQNVKQVRAIGGSGKFVTRDEDQVITGTKTIGFVSDPDDPKTSDEPGEIVISAQGKLNTTSRGLADVPASIIQVTNEDSELVDDKNSKTIVGAGYILSNFVTKTSTQGDTIKGAKQFDVIPTIGGTLPASQDTPAQLTTVQTVDAKVEAAVDGLTLNNIAAGTTAPIDAGDLNIQKLADPREDNAAAGIDGGKDAATRDYVDGVTPRQVNQGMKQKKIVNLRTPTENTDAVNKAYVDNLVKGLRVLPACRLATAATITDPPFNKDNPTAPTRFMPGGAPREIDGEVLNIGDIILIKDQQDAGELEGFSVVNGIYRVPEDDADGAVPLERVDQLKDGDHAASAFTFINHGTANNDHGFVCTNETNKDEVGKDALAFNKFSDAQGGVPIQGGAGIDVTEGVVRALVKSPIEVGAAGTPIQLNKDKTGEFLTGTPASKDGGTPKVDGAKMHFGADHSDLIIDCGTYPTKK